MGARSCANRQSDVVGAWLCGYVAMWLTVPFERRWNPLWGLFSGRFADAFRGYSARIAPGKGAARAK